MDERAILSQLIDHVQRMLSSRARQRSVTAQSRLREELGLDSLGLITLMSYLEEELSIDLEAHASSVARAETLADIARVALDAVSSQRGARPRG